MSRLQEQVRRATLLLPVVLQEARNTNSRDINIVGYPPNMRPSEGHARATKESIDNLPQVKVVDQGNECSICWIEFEVGATNVKEMPCKHQFCEECIRKWLAIRGECPVCRFSMPVEEEEVQPPAWGIRFILPFTNDEVEGEGSEVPAVNIYVE